MDGPSPQDVPRARWGCGQDEGGSDLLPPGDGIWEMVPRSGWESAASSRDRAGGEGKIPGEAGDGHGRGQPGLGTVTAGSRGLREGCGAGMEVRREASEERTKAALSDRARPPAEQEPGQEKQGLERGAAAHRVPGRGQGASVHSVAEEAGAGTRWLGCHGPAGPGTGAGGSPSALHQPRAERGDPGTGPTLGLLGSGAALGGRRRWAGTGTQTQSGRRAQEFEDGLQAALPGQQRLIQANSITAPCHEAEGRAWGRPGGPAGTGGL